MPIGRKLLISSLAGIPILGLAAAVLANKRRSYTSDGMVTPQMLSPGDPDSLASYAEFLANEEAAYKSESYDRVASKLMEDYRANQEVENAKSQAYDVDLTNEPEVIQGLGGMNLIDRELLRREQEQAALGAPITNGFNPLRSVNNILGKTQGYEYDPTFINRMGL